MKIQGIISLLEKDHNEYPSKRKQKILLAAGAAGILLLMIPSWISNSESRIDVPASGNDSAKGTDWAREQETSLENIIGQIEGAGNTQVMITLETESETVYAMDRRTDSDSVQEDHVLLSGSSKGLVETIWMPQIQGVAVVCQGADSIAVQGKITEMVSVLMGVPSNRISIAKMRESK